MSDLATDFAKEPSAEQVKELTLKTLKDASASAEQEAEKASKLAEEWFGDVVTDESVEDYQDSVLERTKVLRDRKPPTGQERLDLLKKYRKEYPRAVDSAYRLYFAYIPAVDPSLELVLPPISELNALSTDFNNADQTAIQLIRSTSEEMSMRLIKLISLDKYEVYAMIDQLFAFSNFLASKMHARSVT